MVALIATLTIADILLGDTRAEASGASRSAGGVAHLHVVRRARR
jgi:hypothetical protein